MNEHIDTITRTATENVEAEIQHGGAMVAIVRDRQQLVEVEMEKADLKTKALVLTAVFRLSCVE